MKKDRQQLLSQFKRFLSEHPQLVQEIRLQQRTLQDVFEEYVLLGEDDPGWENYREHKKKKKEAKEDSSSAQLLSTIMSHINLDNVDKHIEQADQIIGGIIRMLEQYQQENKKEETSAPHSFIPRD